MMPRGSRATQLHRRQAIVISDMPNSLNALPLDHVILAIDSLDRGIDRLAEMTGVSAQMGGAHPGRGTRNALLGLGDDQYLELIAPNPADASPPLRPGPFDEQVDFTRFGSLTPIGWVVRVLDADAERDRLIERGLSPGPVHVGERARADGRVLRWKTFDPFGFRAAVLPFAISWGEDTPHPSASAPVGCTLGALRLERPDADVIRDMLTRAGWPVPVSSAPSERIEVLLRCPRGSVMLPL